MALREILFRAKSWNTGEWIQGDLMCYADTVQIWYYTDCGKFNAIVEAATVGQYTGLKDKNGSMIFEGDIVKADNGHIGFVDFIQGEFVKHCKCPNQVVELYGGDNVVIGNIHDNPELLGGGGDG